MEKEAEQTGKLVIVKDMAEAVSGVGEGPDEIKKTAKIEIVLGGKKEKELEKEKKKEKGDKQQTGDRILQVELTEAEIIAPTQREAPKSGKMGEEDKGGSWTETQLEKCAEPWEEEGGKKKGTGQQREGESGPEKSTSSEGTFPSRVQAVHQAVLQDGGHSSEIEGRPQGTEKVGIGIEEQKEVKEAVLHLEDTISTTQEEPGVLRKVGVIAGRPGSHSKGVLFLEDVTKMVQERPGAILGLEMMQRRSESHVEGVLHLEDMLQKVSGDQGEMRETRTLVLSAPREMEDVLQIEDNPKRVSEEQGALQESCGEDTGESEVSDQEREGSARTRGQREGKGLDGTNNTQIQTGEQDSGETESGEGGGVPMEIAQEKICIEKIQALSRIDPDWCIPMEIQQEEEEEENVIGKNPTQKEGAKRGRAAIEAIVAQGEEEVHRRAETEGMITSSQDSLEAQRIEQSPERRAGKETPVEASRVEEGRNSEGESQRKRSRIL